jgi:hypothetical protein
MIASVRKAGVPLRFKSGIIFPSLEISHYIILLGDNYNWFNFKYLFRSASVSKTELRRASIHLLLSMLVLPLHFQV